MKETSELEYAEYLSHNGMDIEVLGETFAEPIKKTQSMDFYTRVSIIDVSTGDVVYKDGTPLRYYFEKSNGDDGLKDLVRGIKNNEKYLP